MQMSCPEISQSNLNITGVDVFSSVSAPVILTTFDGYFVDFESHLVKRVIFV